MKSLMAVWLVEVAQNELCPTQFSAGSHTFAAARTSGQV